jgi:hypothetical protein
VFWRKAPKRVHRSLGILVMTTLFGMFPFLKKLFADGGYQGPEFNQALGTSAPASES